MGIEIMGSKRGNPKQHPGGEIAYSFSDSFLVKMRWIFKG